MQDWDYLLGVFIAISAGIASHIGLLLQKKDINELSKGEGIGRSLFKKPVWVLGVCIGSILAAVLLLHERLNWYDLVGIGLMIGGIAFLGFNRWVKLINYL